MYQTSRRQHHYELLPSVNLTTETKRNKEKKKKKKEEEEIKGDGIANEKILLGSLPHLSALSLQPPHPLLLPL